MGRPRRKTSRKAKSITRDKARGDKHVVDGNGSPYRPWISVEMDNFSRSILSIKITREAPR
jgi:hypothetical protein